MDGSTETPIAAAPAPAYDGLPDSRVIGRHQKFPRTTHDEVARINFLAQLNRHLATNVAPFVKTAWERRAEAFAQRLPECVGHIAPAALHGQHRTTQSPGVRAQGEPRHAARNETLRTARIAQARGA